MRHITLLEHTAPGSTRPQAIHPTHPLTDAGRIEFDRLMAGLLPCRTSDPELWFAEQSAQVEAAKALCHTCPLIDRCLAGALERAEPWGVWGGQVFVNGAVVARKRGRGRPSKAEVLMRQAAEGVARQVADSPVAA